MLTIARGEHLLLGAFERVFELKRVEGFQQVIERVDFEGLERVLVVSRNEDEHRHVVDTDGGDDSESIHFWGSARRGKRHRA